MSSIRQRRSTALAAIVVASALPLLAAFHSYPRSLSNHATQQFTGNSPVGRYPNRFMVFADESPLLSSALISQQSVDRSTALLANRRDFVNQGAAIVGAALVTGSLPAYADVSDGNTLPQGAQQFAKLIRVKGDLKNVEKRVKDSASDMDNKEWDNISQFLRQIYQTGDDMKAIGGSIFDPEKKKQALADAESLKKIAKSADVPVSKKDGTAFLDLAYKMDDLFEDFLDQLRDVPDEL